MSTEQISSCKCVADATGTMHCQEEGQQQEEPQDFLAESCQYDGPTESCESCQ